MIGHPPYPGPQARSRLVRPLASITEAAVLAMLVWAALPVISTPVLPLTVTTVESSPGVTEDVRGHVVHRRRLPHRRPPRPAPAGWNVMGVSEAF